MEFLSAPWWSALLAIILIDLVLAGDNAIVIALAARSLPPTLQKRAIVWGAVGAIGVRSLMTVIVVWLLHIPGLLVAGGVALLWIAYRLLLPEADAGDRHGAAPATFWGAMRTIVIADAVMGLDNVLAVAGVARDHPFVLLVGLVLSVALMGVASTFVARLLERAFWLSWVGLGIITFVALRMVWDGSHQILQHAGGLGLGWPS